MTAPTQDPEVGAMSTILVAMEPLDAEARRRVLRWAAARFDLAPAAVSQTQPAPGVVSECVETTSKLGGQAVQFETLGELFGAASPRTNGEKALIAGYWLQIKGGAADLTSQALNTELKHLGHGISNITAALDELKNAKPALAIQLRKSGSSQQARKKYKITTAGERRVDELVTNGGSA